MKVGAAWRHYINAVIAAEISTLTRYCQTTVQFEPRPADRGILLGAIDSPRKLTTGTIEELKGIIAELQTPRTAAILLNGNLNHNLDIEDTLLKLRQVLTRASRVVVVAYNPFLRFLYKAANALGIREGEMPSTFVTEADVESLCKLSGYEFVRRRLVGYSPWRLGGIGNFVNTILPVVPGLRWLAFAEVLVLRPIMPESTPPSLSIVIPARNERGNIENALKRLPDTIDGGKLEIIFVEGHSSDGTWEEIQRVIPLYQNRFSIKSFRQVGKGKSDAVRLGFANATHDLLTILDADLTMPPALLSRFYSAYYRGLGDFINGNRLTYPMEGNAMRPLNHLGNIFFAKALSWVLGVRLGDTLCGTKLLARHDYERMIAWRGDFGDFDPFGDFELIFPASILGLGIVDIPIHYRDRTYGSTNISRFRHGWMLLKMTVIGFLKVTLGRATKA